MSEIDLDIAAEEGRKSMMRRSTIKDQARQTQSEYKRPEFFDVEYAPLDQCSKAIQRKMKLRELASAKGFGLGYLFVCLVILFF